MTHAEQRAAAIRQQIAAEREQVAELETVCDQARLEHEHLLRVQDALPDYFDGAAPTRGSCKGFGRAPENFRSHCRLSKTSNTSDAADIATETRAPLRPLNGEGGVPLRRGDGRPAGRRRSIRDLEAPTSKRPRRPRTAAEMLDQLPSVALVTQDELDAVPQYLRGRIKLERLNEAVREIGRILRRKYALLAKNIRILGAAKAKLHREFTEQTLTEGAEDAHFFCASDLVRVKASFNATTGQGKAILNSLRHVGRLSNLQGGGWNRFILHAD